MAKQTAAADVAVCNTLHENPLHSKHCDALGTHTWIDATHGSALDTVSTYLKSKHPGDSAYIVVPRSSRSKMWARGMKLHALCKQGEEVPGMPHDCSYKGDQNVEVWFDPPELQLECRVTASEKWMMIFGSTVNSNSQADVLIDSGASHSFIDAAYAAKHHIGVLPAKGSVACAGDSKVPIRGVARIKLDMQSYVGVVQAYVIDLPSKDMDIVLGQTWMLEHQAHLRYEKPYGVTFKQRSVTHRCPA